MRPSAPEAPVFRLIVERPSGVRDVSLFARGDAAVRALGYELSSAPWPTLPPRWAVREARLEKRIGDAWERCFTFRVDKPLSEADLGFPDAG